MIVVVGAGPAGLAAGYYLQKKQLPFRILEKATVGWSWQNHYDSLHLHTLKANSALPGLPMPPSTPDFASRQQVVDYLQQYAAHFQLPIQTATAVTQARFDGNQWQLTTTQGSLSAETLIVATGIWSTPVVAPLPGLDSFTGEVVLGRDYRRPAPFEGQRVLVIGAGNTGCEIAAELGNASIDTSLVVRSGVAFVPYPTSAVAIDFSAWFTRHFPRLSNPILRRLRPDYSDIGLPPPPVPPTEAFPVVGFELPEAVAAGRVTVRGPIARIEGDCVTFADDSAETFDTLIFATGYRPTIDFIEPKPALDELGRVRDSQQFPQLYTLGMHYPNTEGWLQAIGRVAKRLVDQIVD